MTARKPPPSAGIRVPWPQVLVIQVLRSPVSECCTCSRCRSRCRAVRRAGAHHATRRPRRARRRRGSSARCGRWRRAAARPGSATACRWSPGRARCAASTPSRTADACCGVCRLERGGGVSMSTRRRSATAAARGSRSSRRPSSSILARLEGRRGRPRADVHARLRHRRDRHAARLAQRREAGRQPRLAGVARHRGVRRRRADATASRKTAIAAIALHDVPAADRALERFVAPAQPGVAAQRHRVLARQRRAARPARGCSRG